MKNKFIKCTGYVITIIAFLFIGRALASMNLDIKKIKDPVFSIILLILLSIGYAIVVYISSYAWETTLEFINKEKIPSKDIINVYVKSNIGKYLPGNVMHFAGRNILAGKLGFKQLDITFCSIIEIAMLIFTDCVLSLIFAVKSFRQILSYLLTKMNLSIFYGILIGLLLLIIVTIWFLVKESGFIKNYKHFFTMNFLKLLCKLFCIYSITLIIPGFFLVLIFKLVLGCDISMQKAMLTISAYTISWVSGYIVPGAPGGIGVRESVLLLILGPFYLNNIVLLASILLRVASILGDLIAFLFEPVLLYFWKPNQN